MTKCCPSYYALRGSTQTTSAEESSSHGVLSRGKENQNQENVLETQSLLATTSVDQRDNDNIHNSASDTNISDKDPLRQNILTRSDQGSSTSGPERTPNPVTSLLRKTQHAVESKDDIILKHLAQIYRELGENLSQVQHLTRILHHSGSGRRRRWQPYTRRHKDFDDLYTSEDNSACDVSKSTESVASEVFFDCISRFSNDFSDTSIKHLHASFTGSPAYLLERSSTFFPEQYKSSDTSARKVFVAASMETQFESTHRLQRYFLIYDEGPRTWRKVTIYASIVSMSTQSAFSGTSCQYDLMSGSRKLPGNIRSQLETALPSLRLRGPITKLSLEITEDAIGNIAVDIAGADITKDLREAAISNEQAILQAVNDLGCSQFLQSEIVVIKRRGPYFSQVLAETQLCVEYRLPFAEAGPPGHNGVKAYFEELKRMYAVRGCEYIVNFVGVVLDDTRKHFKSFLTEEPLYSMMTVFSSAEQHKKRIPWFIREIWAKQVVSAVSDVHAQGLALDGLDALSSIGLRSNGNAILMMGRRVGPSRLNRNGQIPPELRNLSEDAEPPLWIEFRKDIFCLGLTLWLIGEHRHCATGHYCRMIGNTNWPRYSCTASHSNPISSTRCTDPEVPDYFNSLISDCRHSDPSARNPGRALLSSFDHISFLPNMADLVNEVLRKCQTSQTGGLIALCDECSALTTELHYNCAICLMGDFDLCPDCVSSGVHCFVTEHQLVEVRDMA